MIELVNGTPWKEREPYSLAEAHEWRRALASEVSAIDCQLRVKVRRFADLSLEDRRRYGNWDGYYDWRRAAIYAKRGYEVHLRNIKGWIRSTRSEICEILQERGELPDDTSEELVLIYCAYQALREQHISSDSEHRELRRTMGDYLREHLRLRPVAVPVG